MITYKSSNKYEQTFCSAIERGRWGNRSRDTQRFVELKDTFLFINKLFYLFAIKKALSLNAEHFNDNNYLP